MIAVEDAVCGRGHAIDRGVGQVDGLANELHQLVDPFDERRARSDCAGGGGGFLQTQCRFGIFLERHQIGRIGAEPLDDGARDHLAQP